MRVNSDHWSVACGVKTGHYHTVKGTNCQDTAVIAAIPGLAVGVGCDGCGEGEHSEMGAIAISNFALSEIFQLHAAGYTDNLLSELFASIKKFIDLNVTLTCPNKSVGTVANFIKHHWLATIMGFILTDECQIVFWCGDGIYAADEQFSEIDQDNKPLYLAYNCLRAPSMVGVTEENMPTYFSYQKFGPTQTCDRIMVASDGFTTVQEDMHHAAIAKRPNEDLPVSLDGQQWGKKGQFGLKKWMNSRSDRGHFDDDCFIITAERIEDGKG